MRTSDACFRCSGFIGAGTRRTRYIACSERMTDTVNAPDPALLARVRLRAIRTAATAAACFVALYATSLISGGQGSTPVIVFACVLLAVLFPLTGAAAEAALRVLEVRTGRPWLSRAVALVVGVLCFLPLLGAGHDTGISNEGGIRIPPALMLSVLGITLPIAVLMHAVADGIERLARDFQSIRTRIVLVAMLCTIVSLDLVPLMRRGVTVTSGDVDAVVIDYIAFGLAAVLTVPLVYGFAMVVSRRITERLTETAAAMAKVQAGDLSVTLSEEGRDELATVSRAFNAMVREMAEKQFIERAFGRYVTAAVLDGLRARRSLDFVPERLVASVLFADIRGFTAFSETASPEEVMRVLNVYFERIVPVIGDHGGYINKFIGDAVMVVFNAPLDQPDHALRAVACARAMQNAVTELNASGAFGDGRQVHVGIGVNTGPLTAGNVGGATRAEYSVIGDTVNVAARLTGVAAAGQVLVGPDTAAAAGQGLTALPPLSLKGKAHPLPVWSA